MLDNISDHYICQVTRYICWIPCYPTYIHVTQHIYQSAKCNPTYMSNIYVQHIYEGIYVGRQSHICWIYMLRHIYICWVTFSKNINIYVGYICWVTYIYVGLQTLKQGFVDVLVLFTGLQVDIYYICMSTYEKMH